MTRWFNADVPRFPCKPSDKTPITTHGHLDATADKPTVRKWWTKYPKAMTGIPMGVRSGMFCVDLDRKVGGADGLATWDKLVAEHGGCPETRTHRTPSTGRHLLFKYRD